MGGLCSEYIQQSINQWLSSEFEDVVWFELSTELSFKDLRTAMFEGPKKEVLLKFDFFRREATA